MLFKRLISVSLLSCISSVAYAKTPVFLELNAGSFSHDASLENVSTDFGNTLGLGAAAIIELNDTFSAEIGLQDYGQAEIRYVSGPYTVATEQADMSSINIGLRMGVQVNDRIRLYGKTGLALWDLDYRYKDSSSTVDLTADGNDIYFGFGGQLDLNRRAYLGVEYHVLKTDFDVLGVSGDYDTSGVKATLGLKL